jgi:hypothetical protein
MDFDQVPRGALIAGISGVLLFIFMFFSWFGAGTAEVVTPAGGIEIDFGEVPGADTTFNAWQAFDFIDLVLLAAVIASVGLLVMSAMGTSVNLPVAASAITTGLGLIATLLVLYRIIDPPGGADREIGVYLGLLACVGITIGGWLAMQEEGTTFGDLGGGYTGTGGYTDPAGGGYTDPAHTPQSGQAPSHQGSPPPAEGSQPPPPPAR